jgi:alpha-L-fucosidase
MELLNFTLYTLFVCITNTQAVIFKPQNEYKSLTHNNASVPIDLSYYFNNRAFGLKPNDSSFDGSGSE